MFKNLINRATDLPAQIVDNKKDIAKIAIILTTAVAVNVIGTLIGHAVEEALYND